jgi:signal transduction histidine kinase
MDPLTIALIVLNLFLGGSILIRTKKDMGATIFFLITCVFSLLSVANEYSLPGEIISPYPFLLRIDALHWLRFEMFLAAWHTFLFFVFVHVFTRPKYSYSWPRSTVVFAIFACVLVISLSPLLFSGISLNDATGQTEPHPGPLFGVYALWLFVTMVLSIRQIAVMYKKSTGAERMQWKYIAGGAVATYLALIVFNFVFAGVFQNTYFVKYTPLFSIPIMVATAYAIIRHNLFNIKVLATEGFVFVISVIYVAKLISSHAIIDAITLIATILFGLFLVRSVKEEVRSREKIQELAVRLSDTNDELAQSNEKLRILDQRKSEFVSIVSHQLRTPITAMKGYTSLLLEESYGKLSDEQKAPIEKIFHSAERLATMVTEFLDISKIEQGTMTYTFTSVDLGTMLQELTEEFAKKADAKGLRLYLTPPDADSLIASADEGKIRQCFSNLIDNSIKYTPKGEVHITIEKTGKYVITKITDTGIGLSQDDIHHLFGKFTRGSEGQKHNTEGSGIGLYVAKQMIEAMRGKIWIDSEGPGKGTTFFIELPAVEKV